MSNVFVNGLNSKVGGGKSILNNYLAFLKEKKSNDRYFILTPNKKEYLSYSCKWIEIIDIARWYKKDIFFPLVNHFKLPSVIKQLKIDAVVNLSDIVIPTDVRQLYLCDWPYAVYPESIVWKKMDCQGFIRNTIKMFVFRKYIRYSSLIVVQSKTMKKRLEAKYGLRHAEIVPNAVTRENLTGGEPRDFNLPVDRLKLLYLTHYYLHKNLEVFLPLAKRVRDLALPYCIIITIKDDQHRGAKRFLRAVEKEGLKDTIINIGPVSMGHVPSLYAQCDALLMPTLLESYGLPYVEAMYHRLPILTSNLDFAVDVCGKSAYYFDPLDSEAILNTIKSAFEDVELRQEKINEGQRRLGELPDWRQVFNRYHELLGVETR